jgi:hypothetical protein
LAVYDAPEGGEVSALIPIDLGRLGLDLDLTNAEARDRLRTERTDLALWQAAVDRCSEQIKELEALLRERRMALMVREFLPQSEKAQRQTQRGL